MGQRYMQMIRRLAAGMAILSLVACAASSTLSLVHEKESADSYALAHVNVITMSKDRTILKDASVAISKGRIVAINQPLPRDAKIIDGTGQWLIPGLIDMHVHNPADISFGPAYPTRGGTLHFDTQDLMLLYVANGVTTVLDLNSRPDHFGQRNDIIHGKVLGPRIALAMLIDGGQGGNSANSPLEGRQTVRIAKAQGYDFVKPYSHLSTDTFLAIVDEAAKQDMKVVGHIPNAFRLKLDEAFVPHFGMVAHAEEFSKQSASLSDADIEHYAQLAKQNGTWVMPTLTTMESIVRQQRSLDEISLLPALKYVPPILQDKWLHANGYYRGPNANYSARMDKVLDFHKRLVKALKQAGVPMVAGTDAGCSGLVWGFALHDELDLLAASGLSNEEALAAATRLPAQWLAIDDKIGSIEVGKQADLVLLADNPLEKITNTRHIAGVFVNGKWLARRQMDGMLDELAARNKANLGQYSWKDRSRY